MNTFKVINFVNKNFEFIILQLMFQVISLTSSLLKLTIYQLSSFP